MCIALDFIGHGGSSPASNPNQNYTYHYFTTIVANFVETLQLNYVLVGHSMGGHVIMEGLKLWTGLKAFVIFGAPPVKIPLNIAEAFKANENMGLLFKTDLTDDEQKLIINHIYTVNSSIDKQNLLAQFKQTDKQFRIALAQNLVLADEANLMAENKIPVAIFEGELDSLLAKGYIDSLHLPSLWRSKVQYIHNAGHTPQWENPLEFNELLFDFLKEVV